MAKKQQAVTIPESIKKCFEDYGFDPNQMKLEWAVATREANGWFAILFQLPDGTYLAADFSYRNGWEVQNDGIDGFESVNQFLTESLTQSFF